MSDTTGRRREKHLTLDQAKLKRAQKILGTKSEAETIERALDLIIGEDALNRRAWAAHDRFLRAAAREEVQIHDAFNRLRAE
jgi:hypothetical protein